jgi:hypothetical protein
LKFVPIARDGHKKKKKKRKILNALSFPNREKEQSMKIEFLFLARFFFVEKVKLVNAREKEENCCHFEKKK